MTPVCDRSHDVTSAGVRKHGNAPFAVRDRIRRSWDLVEHTQVVLERLQQRLCKSQMVVEHSRRHVRAARRLLSSLD
jgi:hypothetical protein